MFFFSFLNYVNIPVNCNKRKFSELLRGIVFNYHMLFSIEIKSITINGITTGINHI